MSNCVRRSMRVMSVGVLLAAVGCVAPGRLDLQREALDNAALFGQFRAYDGHSGKPVDLAEVARRSARHDVIFFGEQHSDPVCNELEAQLFYALACGDRPVALSMEFFEADTQATLDAYLRGRLDEPAFRELTRQSREYVLAHRPLIELCRAAHVPVLAANAPRRLVQTYRRSGLDYAEYRATLPAEDQRWLPRASEHVGGRYEAAFFEMMADHGGGPPPAVTPQPTTTPSTAPVESQPADTQPTDSQSADSQPAESQPVEPVPVSQPVVAPADPHAMLAGFYRSQLLWDDAMAESVADYRAIHPRRRVFHIVGGFHVADSGGTVTKFRARRPDDRVFTIVYAATTDGRLRFDPEDQNAGDVVIYGISPPEKEEREGSTMPGPKPPGMPAPATAPTEGLPATAPASEATTAESMPASMPATSTVDAATGD